MSPRAGWQTTHSRVSPLDLAGPPEAVVPAIPDLRYLNSRPGRASIQALAGETLKVTRQGRSCCSQLEFCGVFYEVPHDLGTQPQLHLPRRSQSPPSHSNLVEPRQKSTTSVSHGLNGASCKALESHGLAESPSRSFS